MIGQTISHYKILSKLGEGGMGVVYKAEDTKLKRIVALKFLPPELTRDKSAKTRFIHEAQAASALQHHNICTIHEIDETKDGRLFICMDCYEGESLKTKIGRGPLKLEDALDIAMQIARGLGEAHGQRIIHRDIKPANILMTKDGLVKIADFGLAKLARVKLTKTGRTLGTAQYMSPEQARGEEVDARSDIFSLGAVLYEMIAGKTAFPSDYEPATLYAIINQDPEPLTALRSGVPMELERIVKKTLAKKPSERYQHADDFIVDLKGVARTLETGVSAGTKPFPAGPSRRSRVPWIIGTFVLAAAIAVSAYFIFGGKHVTNRLTSPVATTQMGPPAWSDSVAVLPFKDFSPEKDQEYFCDGMTDDIITKLSNIHDLKVISRTSTMRYKDTTKSIREIGEELGVSTVLEGSIQKERDRIRVNAQLIRTADDAHLWATTYDRKLESVFEIQDDISLAIVDALKMKLTPDEQQKLSGHPIGSVKAYECYLKASHQIIRFDEKSLDSAFVYLQGAIDIMGDNAELYAGLAWACWQYGNMGMGQEDYFQRAEEYAKKALALDPELPHALNIIGVLSIYKEYPDNLHDFFRYMKKSLEGHPDDIETLDILADIYQVIGRSSKAAALVEKIGRLDPLNPGLHRRRGFGHLYDCQFGAALDECRVYYKADSTSQNAQTVYSWMLAYNGEREEALAVIDRMGTANAGNAIARMSLLLKYALLKDKEKALRLMTPEFRKTCWRDSEWSYWVADRLSLLGAKEEALDWLENSVHRGFINYPLLQCDRFLDNIRGEGRFKKLAEWAKNEWEHFEVPE
jgi:serine/threonine protein kinase/tetratricopeptide (TPR) repeat protein